MSAEEYDPESRPADETSGGRGGLASRATIVQRRREGSGADGTPATLAPTGDTRPGWRPRKPRLSDARWQTIRDTLRIGDVEKFEAEGVGTADAVWRVIGPGGTYPMRTYMPVEDGGKGEERPPEWRLAAYKATLVRRCRREELDRAAALAERKLTKAAEDAAGTLVELSRGDLRKHVVTQLNAKTGELVEVVSPLAANVAMLASEKVLNAVGVSTRVSGGNGSAGTSVAVQVNAGDGAQVSVFEALRRVKSAGSRGEAPRSGRRGARRGKWSKLDEARRVDATVTSADAATTPPTPSAEGA